MGAMAKWWMAGLTALALMGCGEPRPVVETAITGKFKDKDIKLEQFITLKPGSALPGLLGSSPTTSDGTGTAYRITGILMGSSRTDMCDINGSIGNENENDVILMILGTPESSGITTLQKATYLPKDPENTLLVSVFIRAPKQCTGTPAVVAPILEGFVDVQWVEEVTGSVTGEFSIPLGGGENVSGTMNSDGCDPKSPSIKVCEN